VCIRSAHLLPVNDTLTRGFILQISRVANEGLIGVGRESPRSAALVEVMWVELSATVQSSLSHDLFVNYKMFVTR
jgi:hypothetical protein